jgi:hypothetical protein
MNVNVDAGAAGVGCDALVVRAGAAWAAAPPQPQPRLARQIQGDGILWLSATYADYLAAALLVALR